MTIASFEKYLSKGVFNHYKCEWFNNGASIEREYFTEERLKPYVAPSKPCPLCQD